MSKYQHTFFIQLFRFCCILNFCMGTLKIELKPYFVILFYKSALFTFISGLQQLAFLKRKKNLTWDGIITNLVLLPCALHVENHWYKHWCQWILLCTHSHTPFCYCCRQKGYPHKKHWQWVMNNAFKMSGMKYSK